ncbi:MAG: DNA polymerase III subunit gamma/tau, partial [Chitinophagia bacterium]|nr:DNA polymerase III subunit gamma/tau [Chitinophagia bacterium]
NGLAEFFRNLLVCKDRQAASLLDTVETFKLQYEQNAQTTSASYLVSALHILSEAELNYRTARNKRLHVEMALIKLAYLQQALSLSTDESGLVVKKKIADAPLGFRTTPIRLYTGSGPTKKPAASASTPRSKAPAASTSPAAPATAIDAPLPTARQTIETPRLSALDKIRQQFKGNGSEKNKDADNTLAHETLTSAWGRYTDKLRADRHPAAQPFGSAQLRISDANSFEVVTANNIEQKFIEQERNSLFQFLQQQLQIRGLQFTVLVQEPSGDASPAEGMLSSKEQFQELVKQYPLVQELKERLRLELDY